MNPPGIVARSTSGWFGVESDGVIHGWARDRADPNERLTVAIAIDGQRIATACCDRLVPNLRDQEGSDGFSGFACAVPQGWRDGHSHEVTVEVPLSDDGAVSLKSNRGSFTLAPGAASVALVLDGGDDGGISGSIIGPNGRELVDLWIDGRRVTQDVTPEWRWDEGAVRPFHLPWPGGVLALAAAGAVLAYPGTIEAGMQGVAVASLVAGTIRFDADGDYRLQLDSRLHLSEGAALTAELIGGARPISVDLRLKKGVARLALPDIELTTAPSLRLAHADGRPLGEPIPFPASRVPQRLIANADLARWSADGPDGFEPFGAVTRSFHAFPPALKAEQRLSGQVALLPVPAATGACLLAHALPPVARWGEAVIGVQLFARASMPLPLAWEIAGPEGRVATQPLVVGPRWQAVRSILTVPAGSGPLRLQLVRAGDGEPAQLDVAGVTAGDPAAEGFADAAPDPAPAVAGRNLVRNAALLRWPAGLVVAGTGTRLPLAEHWLVAADEEVAIRAAAVAPPAGADGYGLSLSLPADAPACALEIGLESVDPAGAGRLRFRARLDPDGARFGMVDRISLVRRRSGGGDEAVIALIARKLVIGRAWDEHRLSFLCRSAAERRFEGRGGVEHHLRFEFSEGLSIQLHGVDLRLDGEAPVPAGTSPPLAFEDPAIRAQLGELKGLNDWRASGVLRAAGQAGRPAPLLPEPRRWRWSAVAAGTVEVGIAVHDAADETLACLASLQNSTGVPHLVRLLDDASDEDTRQRLTQFIADKPWMRLDRQDRHRGYTATANALVGQSAADWVVLLNSDTVVGTGWLEGLLAAALADERTAMVGPVSNAATYQSVPDPYDGTGKWAVNPLPPGWTAARMAAFVEEVSEAAHPEVPLLNGFCTLIRRAAFDAVGGFDERSFPAGYGEENDLCLRLRKAGWRLRVADDVYVWHAKSASFGPARRAQLSKAGDAAFRALHADVDVPALGRQFLATPALARLRDAVRDAYPPATRPAEEDA